MIIPIASDHAGYAAKELAKNVLQDLGYEVNDMGVNSEESVDYPDFAVLVANAVSEGKYPRGILICGSGQGMCITANKVERVRAALAWDPEISKLAAQHNDANVLCLPGRFLSETQIREIITSWLETPFEGGRHENRVKKIHDNTRKP
ncbi:MAG: ribose 5-phosphate isomerase B [Bacteroidetes bacterium]|nr:ribose 5-phosphate isomerase B [Bacteroidota bacterium]MCH8523100.1 ribose 5-phosphate isomerase B [Balneolales bacterium]